jgi:hypothetical protein
MWLILMVLLPTNLLNGIYNHITSTPTYEYRIEWLRRPIQTKDIEHLDIRLFHSPRVEHHSIKAKID